MVASTAPTHSPGDLRGRMQLKVASSRETGPIIRSLPNNVLSACLPDFLASFPSHSP